VEQELKEIRYQSRTYARLETLMNRVNERSLKEEHRKQVQKKAVGIDGVMHKPIAKTMDRIQLSLQGHFNYYGVSGNLVQIYKFWKYVRYEYYRVLNKRHQKRSMKYLDYLRIWNYYVREPHLTKDIWDWQPKLV